MEINAKSKTLVDKAVSTRVNYLVRVFITDLT